MNTRSRSFTCIAVVLMATTLAVGCSSGDDDGNETSAISSVDAREDLVSSVRGRFDAGLFRFYPAETLVDFLPNTTYRTESAGDVQASDAAVLGQIVAVEPGAGFVAGEEQGGPDGVETSFDDPAALWRTVELQVQVDQSFGGPIASGDTVTVGFAIGNVEELETVREGFRSLGSLLLFLNDDAPTMAYDPELWGMTADGRYLATVARDGRLELPFSGEGEDPSLVGDGLTIDDVRAAADGPGRTIVVEGSEGSEGSEDTEVVAG